MVFNLHYLSCIRTVATVRERGYVHYVRHGQSTSIPFHREKLYDHVMAAGLEKQFLQKYEKLPDSIWIRHQMVYLNRIIQQLLAKNCNLKLPEICAYLKQVNTPEKLKRNGRLCLFFDWNVLKNRQDRFFYTVFNLKWYGLMAAALLFFRRKNA